MVKQLRRMGAVKDLISATIFLASQASALFYRLDFACRWWNLGGYFMAH